MHKPLAQSFVEPSGLVPNVMGVVSLGIGMSAAAFTLTDFPVPWDEFGTVGVEVFYAGAWHQSDSLYMAYFELDPYPNVLIASWYPFIDPGGMPWRFTAPLTEATVAGQPLNPSSGVVGPYEAMRAGGMDLGSLAAKIAGSKLLTKEFKSR